MTDPTTPTASHLPADVARLVERLRSPLPVCPYDRRSPEYWTASDTEPCRICGTKNEPDAPDLCRGADTSCMTAAAEMITRLAGELAAVKAEVADTAALNRMEVEGAVQVLMGMKTRAEKAEADRQTFETACINAVADRREATDELLREREARQKAEAELERLRKVIFDATSHAESIWDDGMAALKGEENG